MKFRLWAIAAAVATFTGCGGDDDAAQEVATIATTKSCDTASMQSVQLSNAQINAATSVPAGNYMVPGTNTTLTNLPAFCRVDASATPSTDSLINFQVWVPVGAAWNGKLVTTGNGGYSPSLNFGDMAYAMRQGYAVIGGDTGHQSADPNDLSWGMGHPEKIIDWGTRSINAITARGKTIVTQLQGRGASRSYYYGCSTGGHQGYAEMQRYPQDFDGMINGAPGNNRVRLNIEFLYRFQVNRPPNNDTQLILSPAKSAVITNAAIAACDALDGVTDGVMEDPRVCTSARFNVDSLLCTGPETPTCLTAAQLDVARKIYAGPKNPRTGEQLYLGYPVGSESGWAAQWGTTEPARAGFWRFWVFDDPTWNWWTFDYDSHVALTDTKVGGLVDQINPNVNAFKARGGKNIVYHGWSDPVVNPLDTIAYYEQVRAQQGSQAEIDNFFRLFLVPGMGHCAGGIGTGNFGNQGGQSPVVDADRDVLMALDRWVETSVAPDRIVASRVVMGNVVRTRPLCPYPRKAVYSGSGSTDDAANFTCQ